MAMNKDILALQELGFSANDSTVYFSLLENGPSTSAPIIASTHLHRSLVYTSLNNLVRRKLVSETSVKGKRHFKIASPEILEAEFDKKRRLASRMSSVISRELGSVKQEITTHTGNDEYLQLLTSLIDSLPIGSTKYVMGTGGESFMRQTMRLIWKKYHMVAKRRALSIRMIGYHGQEDAINPDILDEGIYDMKYLPKNLENPAGIHIYPEINTVLNIIYSDYDNPVTAIKIIDPRMTQGYLNLFENLWCQA